MKQKAAEAWPQINSPPTRVGVPPCRFRPGAPHGFHADYRPSYRQDAAEDAWNQMIAWFKKYKVLA